MNDSVLFLLWEVMAIIHVLFFLTVENAKKKYIHVILLLPQDNHSSHFNIDFFRLFPTNTYLQMCFPRKERPEHAGQTSFSHVTIGHEHGRDTGMSSVVLAR